MISVLEDARTIKNSSNRRKQISNIIGTYIEADLNDFSTLAKTKSTILDKISLK
jgi:hypothetical protein